MKDINMLDVGLYYQFPYKLIKPIYYSNGMIQQIGYVALNWLINNDCKKPKCRIIKKICPKARVQ